SVASLTTRPPPWSAQAHQRGAFYFGGLGRFPWAETKRQAPLISSAAYFSQLVVWAETKRQARRLFQPDTGHCRTSTNRPAIAAAAAMTGDTRWVRPRKP